MTLLITFSDIFNFWIKQFFLVYYLGPPSKFKYVINMVNSGYVDY